MESHRRGPSGIVSAKLGLYRKNTRCSPLLFFSPSSTDLGRHTGYFPPFSAPEAMPSNLSDVVQERSDPGRRPDQRAPLGGSPPDPAPEPGPVAGRHRSSRASPDADHQVDSTQ